MLVATRTPGRHRQLPRARPTSCVRIANKSGGLPSTTDFSPPTLNSPTNEDSPLPERVEADAYIEIFTTDTDAGDVDAENFFDCEIHGHAFRAVFVIENLVTSSPCHRPPKHAYTPRILSDLGPRVPQKAD